MRHRFAMLTVYMTVLALVIGNLVVATNAGEACGTDWPMCNGKLIPDFTNYKVLIEYSHRIFTGSLGFIILINAIIAWKRKYARETSIKTWSILTAALLLVQSMVGALNVVLGSPSGFTTIDVTVSLLLLTSTVFLATALQRKRTASKIADSKENQQHKRLLKPAVYAFLLFFLEVVIGAFFKHSGASKQIHDMAGNDMLIDSISLSQLIYNVHGISNTVILLSAAYLLFQSLKKKLLIKESVIYFVLIIMNGIAGFITQIYALEASASSIHMIVVIFTVFQGAYVVSKSYFGPYYLYDYTGEGEKYAG